MDGPRVHFGGARYIRQLHIMSTWYQEQIMNNPALDFIHVNPGKEKQKKSIALSASSKRENDLY